MERLTYLDKDGCARLKESFMSNGEQNIISRLFQYEDAEENGMLMILPCRPDHRVYFIKEDLDSNSLDTYFWIDSRTFKISDMKMIGKTVFLTLEEAEQKLKEIQNDH